MFVGKSKNQPPSALSNFGRSFQSPLCNLGVPSFCVLEVVEVINICFPPSVGEEATQLIQCEPRLIPAQVHLSSCRFLVSRYIRQEAMLTAVFKRRWWGFIHARQNLWWCSGNETLFSLFRLCGKTATTSTTWSENANQKESRRDSPDENWVHAK